MFDQLEFKPKPRPEKKKRWHDGLSLAFATLMTAIGLFGVWAGLSAIEDAEAHRQIILYNAKFTYACGFFVLFGLNLFVRGYDGMDFTMAEGERPAAKWMIALIILSFIASIAFGIWVEHRLSELGYS